MTTGTTSAVAAPLATIFAINDDFVLQEPIETAWGKVFDRAHQPRRSRTQQLSIAR
jgi:hypothetical protein